MIATLWTRLYGKPSPLMIRTNPPLREGRKLREKERIQETGKIAMNYRDTFKEPTHIYTCKRREKRTDQGLAISG
jgi:hypothetical protein